MDIAVTDTPEPRQLLRDREPEIAALEDAIEWAQRGDGGVLVLRGPAGIGKSALLLEAQMRAAKRGLLVLAARAAPLESGFPYGVARQLFEQIAAREGPQAQLFAGAAARARDVLEDTPREMAGEDPSFASLHALYWLTSNLSERAPMLIAVDDVSWCDTPSLRFLEFLVRRLGGMPVTLALAYRAGEPPFPEALGVLERDPLARIVQPGPLSRATIAALVAEALGEEADPEFSTACHEVTGGNPLLASELLRALGAEAVRPRAGEIGRVREIGAVAVGPAVRDRLALLGEQSRLVANALAILGESARNEDVAGVTAIGGVELEDVIATLARAGMVTRGERLSFVHPLVAEAVRSSLGGGERARLHAAAVEAMVRRGAGPWELAPHLLSVTPGTQPEAVSILRDAARWALGAGAPEAAITYLTRALKEPSEDHRPALLLDLGTAKLQAGDASAPEDLARAIRFARDTRTRALARIAMSAAFVTAGDYSRSAEVLDEGIDETASEDANLARRMEAQLLANVLMAGPSAGTFLASLGNRVVHARPVRPARTVSEHLLLGSIAFKELLGGATADEVIDLAEAALSAEEVISAEGQTWLPFYLAIVALAFCDQHDRVAAVTTVALARARTSASLRGFVWASAWRAHANLHLGRLIDAEADARVALDSAERRLSDPSVTAARAWLAGTLTAQGRFEEASSTLVETVAPDPPNLLTYLLLGNRATLHLASGEFAAAAGDLEHYQELGASNAHLAPWLGPAIAAFPYRSLWARALIGLGDRDRARALIAEELPIARTLGTDRAVGMTLHVASLLERGEAQLDMLRDAVARLARSQSRLEYAAALLDYGAALRRGNRRAEARTPLKAALQIARDAHAMPLQERAGDELRAAGARVSRPQASGIDALTASERRIAAMAAAGMKNRDIAQALFVTIKTVETHLGHTYQKLNLSGRGELAVVLDRDGGSAEGTLDAQLARAERD